MKQNIIFIVVLTQSIWCFGQSTSIETNEMRRFYFSFSVNGLPVNQKVSNIDFLYYDGKVLSNIPIDTIKAIYRTQNQYLNTSIGFGLTYYLFEDFNLSLNTKPHINSFISNKKKDGKVYGVQFDLTSNYEKKISGKLFFTAGLGISRIIGGYGITSGGASKKEFLLVNGNELHDQDIGFHIIDNSWAVKLELGSKYKLPKGLHAFANFGYQFTFNRTSRMNFAGLKKEGSLKWNSKTYDDTDLFLNIDGQRINNDNFYNLPFNFGGLTLQLGVSIALNKRK